MGQDNTLLLGLVVEEQIELTLLELCQASQAEEAHIVTWVQEGMLEPSGDSPPNWRFHGDALRRACLALRLSRDLEINAPGVALALELLDEIAALRAHLQRAGLR